ncbi:MAG TPA: sigma-70 family RNA polymerase sigma factor [Bacteroidota bacterium]|nr:sigma-70 family RNA polymerase sigma factor [Bacteroidota bacterium]
MQVSTDAELLSRIRAGDQASFTMLYEKYKRRLFGYCYRLIQDRQSAEDVVQTTFIKAFESIQTLDKPELFYYWLFTIARNEVYGFVRRKRSNRIVRSLEDEEDIWEVESPHVQMVQQETSELVQQLLNQLKVEYREVLILRHYDKLSYAEIAAITGDTIPSVESRIFKARKALAKNLKPYFD